MEELKRPFLQYYGAKWAVAKKIYPEPRLDTLIEPFAGAAGYASRYPWKKVWLNDLDPIIYSVWKYLVESKEEEILSLPLIFEDVRYLSVCQEAKWLIGFWINTGSASPKNLPSPRMKSGARPNGYWGESIRAAIAAQQRLIRHWRVTNLNYNELPDTEATWFIDPPYKGRAGQYYRKKLTDFTALAEWCKSRKGQVIVCEGPGGDWLPFKFAAEIGGNRRKNNVGGKSREYIWTND